MLRSFAPVTLRVASRVTIRCITDTTSHILEPYAGMQLESTKLAPMLGDPPEEIDDSNVPEGFSYLNFKVVENGYWDSTHGVFTHFFFPFF